MHRSRALGVVSIALVLVFGISSSAYGVTYHSPLTKVGTRDGYSCYVQSFVIRPTSDDDYTVRAEATTGKSTTGIYARAKMYEWAGTQGWHLMVDTGYKQGSDGYAHAGSAMYDFGYGAKCIAYAKFTWGSAADLVGSVSNSTYY